MHSEIITVADLARAVEALRKGQLVVFPTDTVYGVAALAEDEAAVEALYEAKGRDARLALPVMIATPDLVPSIAHPQAGFWILAQRFWPGPLTIILPKTEALPNIITAGKSSVGLRIPDHRLALHLLRMVAAPLAVTSANRSGHPPARTAVKARDQLEGRVHIIVDGGPAPGGQPSTVIDLTAHPPTILRPGPISAPELQQTLGVYVKP